MQSTSQIIQILEAAPVAPEAPQDAFACYKEGLDLSANHWARIRRIATQDTRRAVYGALFTVCGEGAPKLVNAVAKALFGVDGFNMLADCEILALYHWLKPFRAGDHWATAAQPVYECVSRVRSMVKTIRVEGAR